MVVPSSSDSGNGAPKPATTPPEPQANTPAIHRASFEGAECPTAYTLR